MRGQCACEYASFQIWIVCLCSDGNRSRQSCHRATSTPRLTTLHLLLLLLPSEHALHFQLRNYNAHCLVWDTRKGTPSICFSPSFPPICLSTSPPSLFALSFFPPALCLLCVFVICFYYNFHFLTSRGVRSLSSGLVIFVWILYFSGLVGRLADKIGELR